MSLKIYRRKRKFDRTPEPKAEPARKRKSGELIFVVQKHDASRTHYDFRLELDGALKSWAVPKGPSLRSQDPRLALLVEDHPMDYGSFEGVIPKGNYGAGTVMLWDQGTYVERSAKGRKDSEKALRDGFAKGHLTFLLSGTKLRGEFALVRLKKKGAPENGWLLIKKHDGETSRADVLAQDRSVATSRSMAEIAAQAEKRGEIWLPGKGRRPAVPKTKSKALSPAKKKTAAVAMPHRIPLMVPGFVTAAPAGKDWTFELAGMGIRAIAECENGSVRLYSRAFIPLEKKYPKIVQALRQLEKNVILDGELVREAKEVRYRIHDLLYLEGKDLREVPWQKRKILFAALPLTEPLARVQTIPTIDAIPPLAPLAYLLGKKNDSRYKGGVSNDWIRFRPTTKASSAVQASEKPPLTHPDKLYWPKEKITKGDLVQYYETVADTILPHLIDRPQSLHRQPDGVRNAGFFHKDMTSFLPRRIQTVRVPSASSGRTLNYVLCQDRWSLLFLINMGCIELNPWLSRQSNLENPDLVVIDLDPDGNPFSEVVTVAKEVNRLLNSIKAENYCKTSGASGLHICIPTGGKYDFDLGREFAELVCRAVHQKFPKFTSVERNPARRRGKIYLDFLQNRRGQTLAAPYCVRPQPGATVSAPLKWSEVTARLTPLAFTIHTMPRRIAKLGDLWKPMLKGQVDIPACLKRLSKILHT